MPRPPASAGELLFLAMETMLRRYAEAIQAGQSAADTAEPPGQGVATRHDAMAAAYQVAILIAANKPGDAPPDPGQAAGHLMTMMEYIAPLPDDLYPEFKNTLLRFIMDERESGA